jgi:hypothetical protein
MAGNHTPKVKVLPEPPPQKKKKKKKKKKKATRSNRPSKSLFRL